MKRKYHKGNVLSWKHWMELKSNGYTDVIGNVYFEQQRLTSLKGSPITCHNFWCNDNKLISLEGSPIETTHFVCYNNKLTSLEHHPEIFSFIDATNNPLDKTDPCVIMLLLQERLVL